MCAWSRQELVHITRGDGQRAVLPASINNAPRPIDAEPRTYGAALGHPAAMEQGAALHAFCSGWGGEWLGVTCRRGACGIARCIRLCSCAREGSGHECMHVHVACIRCCRHPTRWSPWLNANVVYDSSGDEDLCLLVLARYIECAQGPGQAGQVGQTAEAPRLPAAPHVGQGLVCMCGHLHVARLGPGCACGGMVSVSNSGKHLGRRRKPLQLFAAG